MVMDEAERIKNAASSFMKEGLAAAAAAAATTSRSTSGSGGGGGSGSGGGMNNNTSCNPSSSRHPSSSTDPSFPSTLPVMGHGMGVQGWLLGCCQVHGKGGLRDKPGKSCDYYHTCYCLSGLSVSQHYSGLVMGPAESNLLKRTDPRVNVLVEKLDRARAFWLLQ